MANLKKILAWIDKYFNVICFFIIGISGLLKILCVFICPYYVSEDTKSYVYAAKFLLNGGSDYKTSLQARQFLYPGLLSAIQTIAHSNTFFVMALLQAFLSTATVFIGYCIGKKLGWSRWLQLIFLLFLGFDQRMFLYSEIMAPETVIVFFLLTGFLLTLNLTASIKTNQKNLASFYLNSILLALTSLVLFNSKELFTPACLLWYLFLGYQILKKLSFAFVAPLLISVSIFVIGSLLSWQVARQLLQTDRFHPYCNGWAVPGACHLMDTESPPYADFKTKVKKSVLQRRTFLREWNYQWIDHDIKGNVCNDEDFMRDLVSYAEFTTGTKERTEIRCEVEKISKDLYLEGVKSNPIFMITHWFLPEVLHAFFGNDFKSVGYYQGRTLAEQKEYVGEFANEVNPHTWAVETEFREFLAVNLIGERSFMGTLFLILFFATLFAFRKLRKTKDLEFSALVAAYVLAYVILVCFLNYFYERYFLYIDFAMQIFVVSQIDAFSKHYKLEVFIKNSWAQLQLKFR